MSIIPKDTKVLTVSLDFLGVLGSKIDNNYIKSLLSLAPVTKVDFADSNNSLRFILNEDSSTYTLASRLQTTTPKFDFAGLKKGDSLREYLTRSNPVQLELTFTAEESNPKLFILASYFEFAEKGNDYIKFSYLSSSFVGIGMTMKSYANVKKSDNLREINVVFERVDAVIESAKSVINAKDIS